MKEQGRPTLTLRRKAEPEGQRAVNNSEPDGAGPGRVTRKKTVVVNTTPAWKVRKQAVDESAKKAQADEKAARKAEKARQWAERQAQEREAMRRWYLCPQVRVADIVQITPRVRGRSRTWWKLFHMAAQWHCDVVIVDRRTFRVVAAVELDDASHLKKSRCRRDILLDEVMLRKPQYLLCSVLLPCNISAGRCD